MRARSIALVALLIAAPAAAQEASTAEDLICVPRAEAAQLFSTAAEAPLLRAKISTLEQDLGVKDRTIAAQQELLDLTEQISAKHQRLRELAELEREVYRGKAERIETEREKSTRWLRCRANGGAGAVLGLGAGSIFPGIGNIGGAAVGFIAGCLAGFLGAP